MLWVGIICLIAGLAFFAIGSIQTVAHTRSPMDTRLKQITTRTPIERELRPEAGSLAEREEQARAPRKADILPLVSQFLKRFSLFTQLEEDLTMAHSDWRASELMAGSVIVSLVIFSLLQWRLQLLPISIAVSLLVLAFPWTFVKMKRGRWQRRFELQLADTLVLMSNAMKAGYSFMQAIDLVGREALPPMSDEFRRMSQEIAVGVPVEDAMESFGARIKSMDLDLVITAVLIQRVVGGALAEILDNIAKVIRERVRIKGEINTLTTQGKMTGYFLVGMPIALGLFLSVISPGYTTPLFQEAIGQKVILTGGAMQIFGFLVVKRIISIEV